MERKRMPSMPPPSTDPRLNPRLTGYCLRIGDASCTIYASTRDEAVAKVICCYGPPDGHRTVSSVEDRWMVHGVEFAVVEPLPSLASGPGSVGPLTPFSTLEEQWAYIREFGRHLDALFMPRVPARIDRVPSPRIERAASRVMSLLDEVRTGPLGGCKQETIYECVVRILHEECD